MNNFKYLYFIISIHIRKYIHNIFNIHFYVYDIIDSCNVRSCQCCEKCDIKIRYNGDHCWLSYGLYKQMKITNNTADILQSHINSITDI